MRIVLLTKLLLVVATITMIYAFSFGLKLRREMKESRYAEWWASLLWLILFFLMSYVFLTVYLFRMEADDITVGFKVMAAVFFGGAFYVVGTLRLSYRTLKDINDRAKDLQLANQEIQITQEKMVRAEKFAAIGQLASGIGHELRNPLGAIHNALYYLRDIFKDSPLEKEDPMIGEFIDVADSEMDCATRIVSDLLDFSSVVKVSAEPVNLSALLADVRNSLKPPENVRILEEYAPLPMILMDPQKMRQVFLNLGINAIQAMPKGGELRLRTKLIQTGSEPEWVHVDFEDTGVGIKPEDMKKMFEPLFTTKAKGTGLGLAISLGIVEAHGGKIDVSSVPAQGSCFTVKFPLREFCPQDGDRNDG